VRAGERGGARETLLGAAGIRTRDKLSSVNEPLKPLIGIGSDVQRAEDTREGAFAFLTYVEALRQAGAIPVVVPPQPENAEALASALDGILLAGGPDCDPAVYGEDRHPACQTMDVRRQNNDLALARAARHSAIPALGICLGMQVMNVAAGGTLIQDIASHLETSIQHASEPAERARHDIRIEEGTHLASLVREREILVNSSHHQAVGRLASGLRVTAIAPDGIIEGLEDPSHPFYLGVQWHPEDMTGESSASSIFGAFVEAARARALLKREAGVLSPTHGVASE
jgi:putative glutamine amidotransferase